MDEYFVEEKTSYDKILDFFVFVAVFVVTIFLILDLFQIATGLEAIYLWVSVIVLIIFSIDLVRLRRKVDSWGEFFRKNWLDVLATVPFELLAFAMSSIDPGTAAQFGILKLVRLQKLTRAGAISKAARVSKISKEFKAAAHLKQESEKFKEKNRL